MCWILSVNSEPDSVCAAQITQLDRTSVLNALPAAEHEPGVRWGVILSPPLPLPLPLSPSSLRFQQISPGAGAERFIMDLWSTGAAGFVAQVVLLLSSSRGTNGQGESVSVAGLLCCAGSDWTD